MSLKLNNEIKDKKKNILSDIESQYNDLKYVFNEIEKMKNNNKISDYYTTDDIKIKLISVQNLIIGLNLELKELNKWREELNRQKYTTDVDDEDLL